MKFGVEGQSSHLSTDSGAAPDRLQEVQQSSGREAGFVIGLQLSPSQGVSTRLLVIPRGGSDSNYAGKGQEALKCRCSC